MIYTLLATVIVCHALFHNVRLANGAYAWYSTAIASPPLSVYRLFKSFPHTHTHNFTFSIIQKYILGEPKKHISLRKRFFFCEILQLISRVFFLSLYYSSTLPEISNNFSKYRQLESFANRQLNGAKRFINPDGQSGEWDGGIYPRCRGAALDVSMSNIFWNSAAHKCQSGKQQRLQLQSKGGSLP